MDGRLSRRVSTGAELAMLPCRLGMSSPRGPGSDIGTPVISAAGYVYYYSVIALILRTIRLRYDAELKHLGDHCEDPRAPKSALNDGAVISTARLALPHLSGVMHGVQHSRRTRRPSLELPIGSLARTSRFILSLMVREVLVYTQ